ncbi:MAG: folate-binding protein YgfZ [Hyphomicrobiaceae bacterium]
MSRSKVALLPARGVLSVSGPDASRMLQGIVTNDMELLGLQPALHAGLLSPQGKILFDFFIVTSGDGLLIETHKSALAPLKQRLEMYRLRSKADIRDVSADYTVSVAWKENGEAASLAAHSSHTLAFADPRHPGLGERHLASLETNWRRDLSGTDAATEDDYHAHRVALGVPEAGLDFEIGDAFPHEALYDQTRTVSFTKGCYVGQEIVSRMQHRGTARKRVVLVTGERALPQRGAEVQAGGVGIGRLGTVAGTHGLALVRLDRLAEFAAKGEGARAGDVPISVTVQDWVSFSLVPAGTGAPGEPS